jgi:hypothetical protein
MERILKRVGEILGTTILDRQQRIGLARQHIDIESMDQADQPLAGLWCAADEQNVTAGIGCDLAIRANERLQHLGEIFGRRIAQWHRFGTGRPFRRGDCCCLRNRHNAIQRSRLNQRSAVLGQQRLQHRQELRAAQRRIRPQRRRTMDSGVDGVIQLEGGAEDLCDDRSDIRICEIQGNVTRSLVAGTAGCRCLLLACTVRQLGWRETLRRANIAIDARWGTCGRLG